MLQVVGVEAEPVVLRTNDAGRFVPRYPVLACNHCITEVRAEGKRQFLDCTTQDQRYPSLRADDHGVLALNFIRGEIREIPVPPGQEGLGKIAHDEMDLALDGTLKVHTTNRYGGMYEAGLRAGWKRVPEKLRPQVMQQHLNGIAPGARLGAFSMPDPENLDEPFRLEYEYQLPKYVSEAGALRLFQFPDRERTFPEVGLETRRYPLAYLTSEGLERHVVLRLPPCMRVVDLPAAVRLGNRYVAYSETYRQDGHQVVLEVRFERHSRQIPAADYRAYRQLLQRIEQVTRKVVYLELAE
jgi:hypothetical protein